VRRGRRTDADHRAAGEQNPDWHPHSRLPDRLSNAPKRTSAQAEEGAVSAARPQQRARRSARSVSLTGSAPHLAAPAATCTLAAGQSQSPRVTRLRDCVRQDRRFRAAMMSAFSARAVALIILLCNGGNGGPCDVSVHDRNLSGHTRRLPRRRAVRQKTVEPSRRPGR
jgi:hypothetical protein